MNLVILDGHLSSPARIRTLPSGDELLALEVTTRDDDGPARSVAVVLESPPASLSTLDGGTPVVVVGQVRRRFFQAAGRAASATEVVASTVVVRRGGADARARRVLRATVDALAEAID